MMFLFMTTSAAVAEPMSESDIPFRYTTWHIAYEVNADGSYVETQIWSRTILKENALETGKKGSVTFSTSVAKGEILEACTLKKSGQRINAPKDSYQVSINDGYKNASPLYSDETTITVVFPDLAVGDSMVFSSRVTNSEGMFPNQFSILHFFSRFTAYDDVSIEITAPAAMNLKHQSYFLTVLKPVIKEGKQTLRWTYWNKTPEKWTSADNGISVVGDDPSLYVSTFKGYKEITEAYGVRATPKAAVTDRVKQLASDIAADRTTPEMQAHALYDWVAKNISYGGNCIGIGAVVPRDMNVVLDNKLGDCKDHATLLQALLAARNIESEQALINAGDLYQLSGIPVVSAINHVINFIPSLNLFLDSTSSNTPFGMLPVSLGEKPVLLVSHYREGQKTPSSAQYGHEQIMRTNIRINANGSAGGKTDLILKGLPAIEARAIMRLIPREQEEYVAKKLLEYQGTHGSATLQKDDPTALLDTYKLSISFNLEDFVTVGTATGIPVKPVVMTFLPIAGFLKNAYEPSPKKPQICCGGMSIEEYVLEFPETLKIVAVPKDFELSTPIVDYRATYRKSANTLTIRRELKDKTATNVCSAVFAADYKKIMLSIAKDLKSQILLSD
jgi:transglutaminase-like putative cysteine protease